MNIEESINLLEWANLNKLYIETYYECDYHNIYKAIETLLTASEKEKEKNKELENDLKDITKKYMEAESVKFWYNYIHKDKIRKMLQELEDRRNKQPVIGYWSKKAMLEKLLKEE